MDGHVTLRNRNDINSLQLVLSLLYISILSRVIALPSVEYSGRVETDVLGGARRLAS